MFAFIGCKSMVDECNFCLCDKESENFTLEEVGVYTVNGDKITREQFFYDGEH